MSHSLCILAHVLTYTRVCARALCAHASQRNSFSFLCEFAQVVSFFKKFRLGYCISQKVVKPLTQQKETTS